MVAPSPLHCAVVGLGRMGAGIARRLLPAPGGPVATLMVYDTDPQAGRDLAAAGARAAAHLADVRHLPRPRTVWLMVPAGDPVDAVLFSEDGLCHSLEAGDVVVDGGNSHYRDAMRRADRLRAQGIAYLDCGTSGGLRGAEEGLCLMVGGERAAFEQVEALFALLACPAGYAYLGPSGAGHFVKMVHNAIEYGMLQAIGEGLELLHAAPYDVDLAQIATVWTRGSVIRGWLMELAAAALHKNPGLLGVRGVIGGGDTGSWAIEEAWRAGVPFATIALSYALRHRSRQEDSFAAKVVAALRHEFGGHPVVRSAEGPGDSGPHGEPRGGSDRPRYQPWT